MKITTLINHTHFLLIIGYNLNKIAHDVWEKGNTSKHNTDSDNSLNITDLVVISISNSRKSGEGKVAADCKFWHIVFNLIKTKFFDESIGLGMTTLWIIVHVKFIKFIVFFILALVLFESFRQSGWQQEPKAAYEISYNNGDDDQPKNFIEVK